MSRWRRFLANPYKFQTIELLLTRPARRWLAKRQIKQLAPESISRSLGLAGSARLYFQRRRNPQFYFDQGRIPNIVASVPKPQQEETVAQAYQQTICRTFGFRGTRPITFVDRIDWRLAVNDDPDWSRDLHRLDWLVTALLASHYTGEPGYAAAAGEALCHWGQENPPGSAPWSDIFEVAQRAHILTWIVFLGLDLPSFSERAWETALGAVLASGVWTAWLLEFQTPNNHLLIQIIHLLELCLLFPEFPAARAWRQHLASLLAAEVDRQVFPDGFHCELSVFYHRLGLQALLELVALMGRNNLPVPASIRARAASMVETLRLVRRPDGSYPLWGDGFQTDVLLRHDLPALGAFLFSASFTGDPPQARTLWLLNGAWPQPAPAPQPLTHFWPQAGYAVVSRARPEGLWQLTLDCGPFGLAAAPGHAHADCLSVTLNLADQPILTDPGTYSFRDLGWRQYFRSTRAHNTLMVAGRDQTPLNGWFEAGRFARPQVDNAILSEALRFLDASHDGYTRLSRPVRHRRLVLDLPNTGWLIIDLLTGSGPHPVAAHWHFHPAIHLAGGEAAAVSPLTGLVNGQPIFHWQWRTSVDLTARVSSGLDDPPLGWLSETAGLKVAAPVLELAGTVTVPLCLATLIEPTQESGASSLTLERTVNGYAFHIKGQVNDSLILIGLDTSLSLAAAPWDTDGTVFVRQKTPTGQDLLLAGGSRISRKGEDMVSLPRPTAGLLVSRRAEGYILTGDIPLPLGLAAEAATPVLIQGQQAVVAYDRQRRLLRVLE